jgi:hypothetical protein
MFNRPLDAFRVGVVQELRTSSDKWAEPFGTLSISVRG